ncbi:MAG: response regulator [Deltaproteobacteria bacterium]|nr:response regulator [Deltaproteobacteria bacterium]
MAGKESSDSLCKDLAVLVIDDEPIVGRTLRLALGKIGCRIESFTDPAEALERIDEKDFNIVITDVVMGDIDGIQVLEHVMKRNPECKVIIMTAFAMMELARKAMDKGAFDFIAKPFDSEEIREIVRKTARAIRSTDMKESE